MTYTLEIFNTKTGAPETQTLEPSVGSWETGIKGAGSARHEVPLFGAGISPTLIREISTGNKYTLVQRWDGDSHVTYAGVIQDHDYDRDSRTLTITSSELRAAYLDSRMLYGVFSYDPAGTALTVTSKSLSGAARAVLERATSSYWGSFWELPVTLPSDGSGSFSATWRMDERLKLEDHLSQIEAAGCEIHFPPYVSGGDLAWDTTVATKVTYGTATAISASDADSPMIGLRQRTNYVREMTGILGFGKGGTGAPAYGYSPGDGADVISVRDIWLDFPDLDSGRLTAAVEALDELGYPVVQYSFGLQVFPDGPAYVAPGRLIDMTIADDEFIADDTYSLRVIALRGDLTGRVDVEAQLA